ncbi:MAG: hypothetical protein C0605_16385 [Hyphomicrobiales bacterium]|nr:MAG: hypothetical protein C0605_16385 [Hyphomicrobiales bacterium]
MHGLHHPLLAALRQTASPLLPATPLVSRALLGDALGGAFQRPLAELRQALMQGAAPAPLQRALSRAIAIGASSGCDGARGLLSGLRAFERPDCIHPARPLRAAG